MQRVLTCGSDRYEFILDTAQDAEGERLTFNSPHQADSFLRRLLVDTMSRNALRALAGDRGIVSSGHADLIGRLAPKLVSGALRVYRRNLPQPASRGSAAPRSEPERLVPKPAPRAAPPARKKPAPPPPKKEEDPHLANSVPQALVFIQAAETGAPFCEA